MIPPGGLGCGRVAVSGCDAVAAPKAKGRGATEIAKELKMSQASIYRVIANEQLTRAAEFLSQAKRRIDVLLLPALTVDWATPRAAAMRR
jgi:hypothetical protein